MIDDTMKSRTCLITGATSGIGRAAAFSLARKGADLILLGRNQEKGEAVARQIGSTCKGTTVSFYTVDLSLLGQVRNVSETIRSNHPRVDVLINNAGARFDKFQLTSEGNELTFATNHLGHFLLTASLWETMRDKADSRIINVSSGAHEGAKDFSIEDLTVPALYNGKKAYAYAKLSNLLFTYDLSERLKPFNITVNAMHPGGVATNFSRNNGLFAWLKHVAYYIFKRNLLTPEQGAQTIIHLACSSAVNGKSGGYFYNMAECKSSVLSHDRTCMEKLWSVSCELCGVDSHAFLTQH
jgi:retinol dehydrogenase 14